MTATIGWWAELFTEPTPASISVTGGTPTVSTTENHFIQPASASLVITGGVPTQGDLLIRPGAASIALAGGTPSVNVGQVLTPAGASLTATGGTPNVIRNNILSPSGSSLAVTGGTPTVTVAAVPPSFSAAGTPATGNSDPMTASFSAVTGADVFVAVVAQFSGATPTLTATYGGVSMTKTGEIPLNNAGTNGKLALFRLAGSGTGSAKTVSVATTGGYLSIVAPFSVTSVTTVGTAQTVFGNSTSPSQSVTCTAGQLIVSVIANQGIADMTANSGGTSRVFQHGVPGLNNNESLSVRTATASTTFTATLSAADNWGGVAVVLS